MWFSLAVTTGDEDAVVSRDLVATEMTAEQITEAQRLAREWLPKSETQ